MHFLVITVLPDFFSACLNCGVVGRALRAGLWSLTILDLRAYGRGIHRAVDAPPFGGGSGMVLRPDVVDAALTQSQIEGGDSLHYVYPSARGKPFTQKDAEFYAQSERGIVILCGRYEGVDQRVLDKWNVSEFSFGDFVVSGGEIPALTMIDACVRLRKDVLGNADSLTEESFSHDGLLEYPHYTRPAEWEGRKVPDVLLSGHHAKIASWRKRCAEDITESRRPDLWANYAQRLKGEGCKS